MNAKHNKRSRSLGPGTKAMLIGIVTFSAYSFFTKLSSPERVYFEADASGQLRQVVRPTAMAPKLPPLWKPEPQILQSHSSILRLSGRQRAQLEAISNKWLTAKRDLEGQLQLATMPMREGTRSQASLTTIQSKLSGYSELSRIYDETRNRFWSSAIAILGPQQRKRLLEITRDDKEAKG
ncbi:MAG: hypothetical protein ACR2HJ_04705 [Fimbriimonadales bacterium]